MWLLGLEPRSSGRAGSALDYWAISPTLTPSPLIIRSHTQRSASVLCCSCAHTCLGLTPGPVEPLRDSSSEKTHSPSVCRFSVAPRLGHFPYLQCCVEWCCCYSGLVWATILWTFHGCSFFIMSKTLSPSWHLGPLALLFFFDLPWALGVGFCCRYISRG